MGEGFTLSVEKALGDKGVWSHIAAALPSHVVCASWSKLFD